MTPKEKAIELVDKMYNTEHCGIKHFPNKNYCDCTEMNMFNAKQCALVTVDEILEECRLERDWYWEEVKQELENL